ncbi:MAG: hypothetical protein RL441_1419 [Actinomycetota bacterium]|jgi:hypothetical protein
MSFTISIDTRVFHDHLLTMVDEFNAAGATVVPVIKSNGYGLGQDNLCAIADRLDTGTIAVGTIFEAMRALQLFKGEVVVLEPFSPKDEFTQPTWDMIDKTDYRNRLIRVVDSIDALAYLANRGGAVDIVLEGETSMRRFGFTAEQLNIAWKQHADAFLDGRLRLRGLSCHLPLETDETDIDTVVALYQQVIGSGDRLLDAQTVWVSHLVPEQLEQLAARLPDVTINLRSGTALWLGERDALHPFGAVQSVRRISKGDRAGYFQRRAWADGWIITISGGTAHGVGLMAPSVTSTGRTKFGTIAKAGEQALGRLRSPFWYLGDKLDFFESPHQHVSQLFLPADATEPLVGDMLPVDVRFSITHADVVEGIDELLKRWDVYTDQRRAK